MYYKFPKDYLIPVINDYINKDNLGFRCINEFEEDKIRDIYCEEKENYYDDDEYAEKSVEAIIMI